MEINVFFFSPVKFYFEFLRRSRSQRSQFLSNVYRSFATRVSQLKICDFSMEAFKGFEVL